MEAALYLIPTTLGDTDASRVIPQYNCEVIAGIQHFIVENVRSARRFLKKINKAVDIDALTFYVLDEHTNMQEIDAYLEPLKNGNAVGLLSEAGCPAIADPGAAIVLLAHKNHMRVVPLAGPSALLLALMASGFNGQQFAFNGYLPTKPHERVQKIKLLETRAYKENQTQIFIEAPYRNMQLLESLLATLRTQTKLCIAAGLTCAEEYICTKSVAEWKKSSPPKINKVPAIFLLYV
ncbi:MAG: SAM-dependent methyltransferase [Treponema sp.]|nr:SAM-dependent methyltransferase [Treponema sp.]